jgi:hypothetical protein
MTLKNFCKRVRIYRINKINRIKKWPFPSPEALLIALNVAFLCPANLQFLGILEGI